MGPIITIAFIAMLVFLVRAAVRRSQKKPGSNWMWAVSSFVAWIIFAGMSAGSQMSAEVAREAAATAAPAEAADQPADQPASDAQQVATNWYADIGGLQFQILNVAKHSQLGDEDSYDVERPNGEFIVVQLRLANHSHKSAMVSSSDFHLERDGQEYDANSSMAMMKDGFELTQINPGLSRTGAIAFDVPAGTSIGSYSLEVYGNGSDGSQDKTLINLAKSS